jgi:GntR family transcriptional repressor for pyruvate dehydrogenase complex
MVEQGILRMDIAERLILSDDIVEKLITYIAEHKLRAGDMLPSEKMLSDALGVSRLPLREALSRLRALGIISVRQGKGAFIRKVDISSIFRQLSPIIRSQGELDLLHMAEVRLAIEPSVAALAAERRDEDMLSNLTECIERMERDIHDKNQFIACDIRFHQLLAEASDNPILVAMVSTIHDIISVIQYSYPDEITERSKSLEHHKRIFQAIVDNSSVEAALAMDAHLREVIDTLRLERERQ